MSQEPPEQPPQFDPEHGIHKPHKPWPLSWILIIILTYILLQTAYFLLFN